MTDPKKIAFYLRVSRTSQDFPSQTHALREFCKRSGWPVPPAARIFAEKITGKIARRTKLDALLTACRDGHVDAILVYRADRMGNSAQHLHNLFADLERLKIRVVGVADGIDTAVNNSATVTFRGMLIAFAEGARMLISERTTAGLKAARAAGRIGGRPRSRDKKIEQAFALRDANAKKNPAERLSQNAIARKVGLTGAYISYLFSGKRERRKK